ncbi:hypothetical protein [Pseudomonas marginalis]|uniref:hypothetical protein n=1 Tax=Pseudomonas marginalis TaxID=298 RepID=UPI0011B3D56E|nr:hypothetical protein [Pseudomonas marginalis]KAA8555178.1 hypothetical protein FX984_01796 [Pseudomonas marginalis]TWR71926.1 hypothetical protein FIV40_09495 [Pseudomonas marginalis]
MTDYTELQQLAEAAKTEEARVIKLAASGHGWESLPAQASFRCAASPEAVLALIAENEAMAEFKAHMVSLREASGFDSWAEALVEVDKLRAQHGRDSGELRKVCAARDSARRQRDQLKAENKALRRAGTDALRFIAFAFDEGVEGAEIAGRAIENAIGAKS